MSQTYIPVELRRLVVLRAGRCCEYCLINEDDTFFGCEVDHIISEKHGGLTVAGNLAYACLVCNRNKGSDIGSISATTGTFTRLFNPRLDNWPDHFALDGVVIRVLSEIGQVTERILQFNTIEHFNERESLQAQGRYPKAWAPR